MSLIEQIREKIAQGLFEFSQHAVDQSISRHIRVEELREAVATGEVIEDYPKRQVRSQLSYSGVYRGGTAVARSMQLPIASAGEDRYAIPAGPRVVDRFSSAQEVEGDAGEPG